MVPFCGLGVVVVPFCVLGVVVVPFCVLGVVVVPFLCSGGCCGPFLCSRSCHDHHRLSVLFIKKKKFKSQYSSLKNKNKTCLTW